MINIIGLVCRVFANYLEDWSSIPGRVIQKIQNMVLDTSLLITQHYKIGIKGKVEQSRERSSALPFHLSELAIDKVSFESSSTKFANFTYSLVPDRNTWNNSTVCK